MMDKNIVLRYVGEGGYQPGIPACDLTQAMVDAVTDATNWSLEDILALRHGGKPLYELADQSDGIRKELSDGE